MEPKSFEEVHPGIEEYFKVQKEYLAKFGEHSLERTMHYEPLRPSCLNFIEGAKELRRAIRRNKPIDQIPPEMWEHIIFNLTRQKICHFLGGDESKSGKST